MMWWSESDWDETNLGELPARIEFERILGPTYESDTCVEVEPCVVHCPYSGRMT